MPWVLQNASPLELTSVYDSVLTVLFSLILALYSLYFLKSTHIIQYFIYTFIKQDHKRNLLL